jgi:hypothetical protein
MNGLIGGIVKGLSGTRPHLLDLTGNRWILFGRFLLIEKGSVLRKYNRTSSK